MDINNSFNQNYIDFQSYYNKPTFLLQCIFCSSINVRPLTTDGGSMQECLNCKKTYKGNIVSPAVQNFSNSLEATKNPKMLYMSPRKKTKY